MEALYGPRTFALADWDPSSDHPIDLAVRRFALGGQRLSTLLAAWTLSVIERAGCGRASFRTA